MISGILLFVTILALAFLVIRWFRFTNKKKPAPVTVITSDTVSDDLRKKHKIEEGETRYYATQEVACHNKRNDIWLIVDKKVYDVTDYVDEHVGGDAILKKPGQDNTKEFHGIQHPDRAHATLPDFYIGRVKDL